MQKKGEGRGLYRFARQRDRGGKDMQHARVSKDRDGNILARGQKCEKAESTLIS